MPQSNHFKAFVRARMLHTYIMYSLRILVALSGISKISGQMLIPNSYTKYLC